MTKDYLSDDNDSGRGSGRSNTKKKGNGWSWVKYPVYAGFGLAAALLIYRSLGIYRIAFNRFGLDSIGNSCDQFSIVPFIGSAINFGCVNFAWLIVGTVSLFVLAALTLLQSIPTLIYFHDTSIVGMIDQLRYNRKTFSRISTESGDTQEIQSLVDRYNNLAEWQLKTLLILSVLAFAAEAYIVWTARNGRSDLTSVLIDSLAFEVLLFAFLSFKNVFRPIPKRVVKSYS